MRTLIKAIASTLLLLLLAIPCSAADGTGNYYGKFVASNYSNVYHIIFCRDVSKIGNHKTYYETPQAAERDGKEPCSHCGNYIRILLGARNGSEEEQALLEGFGYGYDAGEEVGWYDGYNSGYSDGEKTGYKTGYKDGNSNGTSLTEESIASERKDAANDAYLACLLIGLPVVSFSSAYLAANLCKKREKELNSTIETLKESLRNERNSNVLKKMGSSYPSSSIPFAVSLKTKCIPTKGTTSSLRPYGDFTIYTAPGSKKYHCKYQCCNASIPNHFFECSALLEPCKKCVPSNMYPQPIPEWYEQIRE